ncbi:hypothetical protein [Halomarina oriensis]|uniref:Uncharacterized protein n=1 Tax=Halomarina oriensis TaxID=671145 RepID=A0A6B0GID2_9EURY|nr:hypothetical protein [Halomarina oriensis]MWG33199.1 hypothetical protein [Halomarina oriensis]
MQRRVFLAGLAGAATTLAGCSALGGGGGGEESGTGTIRIRNTDAMPRQVTVSVSGGGETYLEEETVNLALSGDSASRTIENVFTSEAPETATLTVQVSTEDAQTYEWSVSEMSTVQVTVTSGGGVEFGAPE